jgi:hypothetical protein
MADKLYQFSNDYSRNLVMIVGIRCMLLGETPPWFVAEILTAPTKILDRRQEVWSSSGAPISVVEGKVFFPPTKILDRRQEVYNV